MLLSKLKISVYSSKKHVFLLALFFTLKLLPALPGGVAQVPYLIIMDGVRNGAEFSLDKRKYGKC